MKAKVQTYIDDELFAAITQLCKLDERTVSSMAAILLREAVAAKRQEWRIHKALPSLAREKKENQSHRRKWQDIDDMPLTPDEKTK